MCRLFGFRSNVCASVHHDLVLERNSLRVQSQEHRDGWGIASYGSGPLPEVTHGLAPAYQDAQFEQVSQRLSSRAVLAHVRLASIGEVHVRNAHPFLHGKWAFAHNGTICRYSEHQAAIEAQIAPPLRSLVRGETDSERCFFLFLTYLSSLSGSLEGASLRDVARALALTTRRVSELTDTPGEKPSSLNFLITDGQLMAASRRRKSLYFSASALDPTPGQALESLIFASEALSPARPWHQVPEDSIIGVDAQLVFARWDAAELL